MGRVSFKIKSSKNKIVSKSRSFVGSSNSTIDLNDYQKLGQLDRILQKIKLDSKLIDENKKMNQYSGGELVKLGLTKILLNDPDILL